MSDLVRPQIQGLLFDLPTTPRGKEMVPRYAARLDATFAKIADPQHRWNWHYADAKHELLRIAKLIDQLSPAAKAGLTSGPMQNPRHLAEFFRVAADEVDQLRAEYVELDHGGEPRGRGPAVWARAVADAAANAYALITEANPPVVEYYGAAADHPFHRLVAKLFALGGLKASSENQARGAAERFAQKMQKTP